MSTDRKEEDRFNESDWESELYIPEDVPQQNDVLACGIFACAFLERIFMGGGVTSAADFRFTMEDSIAYRRRLALVFLRNGIVAPNETFPPYTLTEPSAPFQLEPIDSTTSSSPLTSQTPSLPASSVDRLITAGKPKTEALATINEEAETEDDDNANFPFDATLDDIAVVENPNGCLTEACIDGWTAVLRRSSRIASNTCVANAGLLSSIMHNSDGFDAELGEFYDDGTDVFTLDRFIIPVRAGKDNQHWAVLCLDMRSKRVDYYDSLESCKGWRRSVFEVVIIWLKQYWDSMKQFSKGQFDEEEWSAMGLRCHDDTPDQDPVNHWNGGVYVCAFIEVLATSDRTPTASQGFKMTPRDIATYRLKLADSLRQTHESCATQITNLDSQATKCNPETPKISYQPPSSPSQPRSSPSLFVKPCNSPSSPPSQPTFIQPRNLLPDKSPTLAPLVIPDLPAKKRRRSDASLKQHTCSHPFERRARTVSAGSSKKPIQRLRIASAESRIAALDDGQAGLLISRSGRERKLTEKAGRLVDQAGSWLLENV
ncbi:hypothetical protein FRC02_012059 [Tulasnella sp. 418]|nr:hypothetical protein FRC02_012059 [Tulasnella sp. 418]